MIGYLKGYLQYKGENYLVINVHDVGYKIEVTDKVIFKFNVESEIELYIYPESNERGQRLFGFLDLDSMHMFESLLSVNGVGPRAALNILSNSNIDDLSSAIENSDVAFLSSIPSLGKKTAERIILDLKGKLVNLELDNSNWNEVRSALINLGYSKIEIDSIYQDFHDRYSEEDNLSVLIKSAILLLNDMKSKKNER
jgi:Holliday junction DNA helicase RuvA